ncbi:uncharacterized protein LOC121810841 [Salvia splendens]|nr:uncharacterized protein LOC121810841 [Salvia splendens]
MCNPPPPNLFLKVFINKNKTKVLFAEADNNFIDVLLSFLTIPLGKIVTILQNHTESESPAAIGSLSTLYNGLSDLDPAHFSTPGAKEMLLNPRSSFRAECRKLAVDVADNAPLQCFLCEDGACIESVVKNVSLYSDISKCECGGSLNEEIRIEECGEDEGGVFVTSPSLFIVSDDLRVAPIVTGILQSLTDFGIADTQGAEMKSFCLGDQEVQKLLKLSLTSATPLTDLILRKKTVENPQSGIWLDHIHQDDAATASKKFGLGAFLQKSMNKLLFAGTTWSRDIVLRACFLTLSLGGVEFLLGNNTPFKSVDNLYRSVSTGIDDKHFATSDAKNRLINPKLPHGYLSKNQLLLPLSEEGPPKLHYKESNIGLLQEEVGVTFTSFKSSKEMFVNKQTTCFVNDDLSMSPSLATRMLILNDLGIPLSHVKETEFHIGVNEALGILKASLVLKTALSDGLIKPMLKRQAKKEG